MDSKRPDPDKLLELAQRDERAAGRGKLKVFFGAAPGVGKTYAMLEDAQRLRGEGVDVVVGVVETHGRAETARLLEGLEILPLRAFTYRGITLREFNLQAAVARRPTLLLLDELAHTNAPDSWHAKRWQDLQDLLDAGIDVYTTLNVQHLESVNDLVAKITGVVVRETVPDALFDQADNVELIDLTSDDLLQRLAEGKVYIPAEAARAMNRFFGKGNLIALRELALRRMADRVEAQAESYRRTQVASLPTALSDRFIVAVSPSPFAQRVVRAAKRQANRLFADWEVVYVERPSADGLAPADKDRVYQTLRLAEQLGARTATITGEDPAAELIRYAVERNASRIIVGKPGRPLWRDRITSSFVDELIRNDAGIDVHVVRGRAEEVVRFSGRSVRRAPEWKGYALAVAVIAACTAVGWPVAKAFHETSTAMLYVLGTVMVALLWGRGPSILASVLGVLGFDFFFIPPFRTFTVHDTRYFFTFVVILVVGNVIATLALRIKINGQSARKHERRTNALYRLTRDLAEAGDRESIIETARANVAALLGCQVAVITSVPPATVRSTWGVENASWPLDVARWVIDHGKVAGLGTDTFPGVDALLIPINASRGTLGALGVRRHDASLARDPEAMLFLETLARHTGLALEQQDLLREAADARMQAEAERLQNTLLASVSHDLRTPLSTITGAASTLMQHGDRLGASETADLISMIHQEADRLGRLVTNLLEVTRLESGALNPNRDWQSLEELVGAALGRMDNALRGRKITVDIAADVPLLRVDALLIEQVFLNLLDNATRHTPDATEIAISARREGNEVVVTVADRGHGLPPGSEDRIFDKFFRGASASSGSGAGLGLAIVRGFVEAHGGTVAARNREGGGAEFEFRLSAADPPPLDLNSDQDDHPPGA